MLTRITILGIVAVLVVSCISKKEYESLKAENKKTIDHLEKEIKDNYKPKEKELEALKQVNNEHLSTIKALENNQIRLKSRISELEYRNKLLSINLDTSGIDTLGLYSVIDSLIKVESNLNSKTDSLQIRLSEYEGKNAALRHVNDSLVKKLDHLSKRNELLLKYGKIVTEIDNSPFLSKRISFLQNTFDFLVVDIEEHEISFFWKDTTDRIYTSLGNVKKAVEGMNKELLFATNAGIYKPGNIPEGLYIENGVKIEEVNLKQPPGYLNFYMNFGNEPNSNGIFLVDQENNPSIIKVNEYSKEKEKSYKWGTQSGPLLLHNGKMNPKFNQGSKSLRVRSGVGIVEGKKLVFIISNEPVNFYDFASIFKDLFGCENALYLDGVISKMYLPDLGRKETGGNFAGMIGILK